MTLGADLVMLAVDERRGTLIQTRQLAFALAGAELVDLARARRIAATPDGRVTLTESLRTGDPVLDATLGALTFNDDGYLLADAVSARLPDRFPRQVRALLDTGELSGREVTTELGGRPAYNGMRVTDPARRRALIERMTSVVGWETDLSLGAFAALAHISGVSSSTLHWGQRRARRNLKDVADRFTDTWRYLPGCPAELALGEDDLASGQIHPMYEQPWRLAICLAVQEAGRRVAALPRPPQGGTALDRDVANAAALDWAYRHGA